MNTRRGFFGQVVGGFVAAVTAKQAVPAESRHSPNTTATPGDILAFKAGSTERLIGVVTATDGLGNLIVATHGVHKVKLQ